MINYKFTEDWFSADDLVQFLPLKTQKEILVETLANLKIEENKVSQELQEKYGEGNIDLTSGEFVSAS